MNKHYTMGLPRFARNDRGARLPTANCPLPTAYDLRLTNLALNIKPSTLNPLRLTTYERTDILLYCYTEILLNCHTAYPLSLRGSKSRGNPMNKRYTMGLPRFARNDRGARLPTANCPLPTAYVNEKYRYTAKLPYGLPLVIARLEEPRQSHPWRYTMGLPRFARNDRGARLPTANCPLPTTHGLRLTTFSFEFFDFSDKEE